MLIGAMNHPARAVGDEIAWMAAMHLDFLDLTLEPPGAASWQVDVRGIRARLEAAHMGVVGHTAYYLPLASPIEELRRGAVAELERCVAVFAELGVRWMNVHPDGGVPMLDRAAVVGGNLESLAEVLSAARPAGVGVMIENLPGTWNSPAQLGELLDALPELGLHLDIGHANLLAPPGMLEAILAAHGGRVQHVHLHDNRGGSADLHLPLGAGTLDVPGALRALKASGYDGTITLEVHSPDTRLLALSRDRLRELWAGTVVPT